jgi:uncharacterized delta-60 repeat protein
VGEKRRRGSLTAVSSAAAVLALSLAAFAYAHHGGRVDHTFNGTGQFVLERTFAKGTGLDAGHRGRVVFAGSHRDEFIVARLRDRGRLDHGFGDDGVATIPATDAEAATTSVAIDRRGGIVLAGMTCTANESSCDIDVYRLTRTGQLTRRFGDHGVVTLAFSNTFNTDPSVALAPRHRIVVEASSCPDGGVFQRQCDVGVVRLQRDGSLGRAFGDRGTSAVFFKQKAKNCGVGFGTAFENVGAMALDSRHRIVLVESCAGEKNAALARLKPNGNLDRSFGHRGRVYKSVRMRSAIAVTTDSRDRIDVAGPNPEGFAVARFRPSGKLDSGFGEEGTAEVTFADDPQGGDVPFAVDVDSRGRIVAGGRLGRRGEDIAGFARFKPNGRIDPRFGHRGTAITKRLNHATAIAIDSRNRIVALGEKYSDVGHMKLVRLHR